MEVLDREVLEGHAGEDSLPISNSKVQGIGSEGSHSDGLETEAMISSVVEVELQLMVDQWVLVDHYHASVRLKAYESFQVEKMRS